MVSSLPHTLTSPHPHSQFNHKENCGKMFRELASSDEPCVIAVWSKIRTSVHTVEHFLTNTP